MFFKIKDENKVLVDFSKESFGTLPIGYFEVETDFNIPSGQPAYFYKWDGSNIIENSDENLINKIKLELTSLPDTFKIISTPVLNQSRYNDFDTTGLESCKVLNINCNRNIELTGLKYGWDGRRLILRNITTNRRIRLGKNSSYSETKNRFFVRSNYNLNQQSAIELIYIDGSWTILKD